MPAIRVHELHHRFGPTLAIEELTFSIEDGIFVVVAGCSGAGKTTLLRLLAGLEPVQGGQIFFGDQDVTRLPASKRGIAMVRQDAALYPQLSALDNVALSLKHRARGKEGKRIAAEALATLRVDNLAEKLPSQLSGGEAQRVALARALAAEPQLLLLDEPLSQIDGVHKEDLIEAIQATSQHTTTLMVSHDPWDTLRLAEEIVILHHGTCLQQGKTAEVYTRPKSKLAGHLLSPIAMNWLPRSTLKHELQPATDRQPRTEPWVGFRPESVRLAEAGQFQNEAGLHLELTELKQHSLGMTCLIECKWRGPQPETGCSAPRAWSPGHGLYPLV